MSTKQENSQPTTDVVEYSPAAKELMEGLQVEIADPQDLAIHIAQRLAHAETWDSLEAIAQGTSWEDHLGEPFNIRRVWFPPSGYEGGLPVYVLCEAVQAETGEFTVLSTGATGVVIAIARALQKGLLDVPVKVVRADKATSNGYYPFRLLRA